MQAARTQTVGLSLFVASLLLAGGLRLAPLDRWSALAPWVLLWGLLAFAGCAVAAHRLAPEPWPGRAERGADLESGEGGGPPEPRIRRQLRLDALLHPATVLPLGIAATSVSYLRAARSSIWRPRRRGRRRDRHRAGRWPLPPSSGDTRSATATSTRASSNG